MNKILSIVFAIALFDFGASAQQAGVYPTLLIGGTNGVLHGVTNTYSTLTTNTYAGNTNIVNFPNNVQSVAEHGTVGFMLSSSDANPSATNCNLVVLLSQSFDNGNTFETVPSIILTNALPTAIQQSLNGVNGFTNRVALFTITGLACTHVAIAGIGNTGNAAAQDVTNLFALFSLQNQRVFTQAAVR